MESSVVLGERSDRDARHRQVRRLARLLDSRFTVPGTRWRFGVDGLLGLVPGVGDVAGLVASSVVVAHAVRLGARGWVLARMMLYVAVDAVLGFVPVLGSVFDFAFKANNRNLELLERQVLDPDAARVAARRNVLTSVAAVVVVTVTLAVLLLAAVVALLSWLF